MGSAIKHEKALLLCDQSLGETDYSKFADSYIHFP